MLRIRPFGYSPNSPTTRSHKNRRETTEKSGHDGQRSGDAKVTTILPEIPPSLRRAGADPFHQAGAVISTYLAVEGS